MQSKEKNDKTICTNSVKPIVPLPAGLVSEITGISKSHVTQIRSGKRSNQTEKGQIVEKVYAYWDAGSSLLIKEIERVIPIVTDL